MEWIPLALSTASTAYDFGSKHLTKKNIKKWTNWLHGAAGLAEAGGRVAGAVNNVYRSSTNRNPYRVVYRQPYESDAHRYYRKQKKKTRRAAAAVRGRHKFRMAVVKAAAANRFKYARRWA